MIGRQYIHEHTVISYSLALTGLPFISSASCFAMSRMILRWILPDGDFGTSSMN